MRHLKFHQIRQFQYFRFGGRVFIKLYNGHSLDERTGKDAILALHDKVEPLYTCKTIQAI